MKLSEFTLEVLKNFSTINSGLVLRKGKIQKTISPDKTLLAEVEIPDDIPSDFGIYDLNQFIGNVTLLDDPELSFNNDEVEIADDLCSMTYRACKENLIVSPPDKKLELGKIDLTFDISSAAMTRLLKMAAMNSLPHLSVQGKNGDMTVFIHEKANDSSNSVVSKVGKHLGDDFTATFKVEHLKMIPDDYTVEVRLGAFSKWTSKNHKLHYFAALEIK